MLDVKELFVAYGQSEALHGIEFSAARKETVAIMGRNGMGKTTLFKSLMGVLPIRSGSIKVDGVERRQGRELQARRQGHRLCAAGSDDLSDPHGRGEHPDGSGEREGTHRPAGDLRALPGAVGHAAAQGREPVGRTAAAARDRAGAGHRTPRCCCSTNRPRASSRRSSRTSPRRSTKSASMRDITIIVSEQVLSFAMDVADRLFVIEGGRLVHETSRVDTDVDRIKQYLSV